VREPRESQGADPARTDMHAGLLGRNPAFDELFLQLHQKLVAETRTQKALLRLQGTLDLLISATAVAQLPVPADAAVPAVAAAGSAVEGGATESDDGAKGGKGDAAAEAQPESAVPSTGRKKRAAREPEQPTDAAAATASGATPRSVKKRQTKGQER
jgi:hypothetical protein